MSEDYKVQITVSLPPSAQYAKGDMLNVRAQDADDLMATLTGLFDGAAASAIVQKFRAFAVQVPEQMTPEQVAAALAKPPSAPRSGGFGGGGGASGGRKGISEKQVGLINRIAGEKGLSEGMLLDLAAQTTSKGFRPKAISGLSSFEASKLIDLLRDSEGVVA